MTFIRPVAASDLDALFSLAHETSFGLTTLPRDRRLLESRIADSLHAFEKIDRRPRGEAYLFVMEDADTGAVVGTSGVVSKVGGFEPWYAYRVETQVHQSTMLNVRSEHTALHLVAEHDGGGEIGSLFLKPEYRGGGRGRLLSLSRFLFIADHRQQFDEEIIAEMRGVIDDAGRSPFWDAVGKHFFQMDFPKADYLSIVNKEFIGDLMPTHPIYITLLPAIAQQAIGRVHDKTRPARQMLESEGFEFRNMVDIFEAGPVLHCPRDMIRSVRDSVVAEVAQVTDEAIEPPEHVVSNARRDFRACLAGIVREHDARVTIDARTAKALGIGVGQRIRLVTSRPTDIDPDMRGAGI